MQKYKIHISDDDLKRKRRIRRRIVQLHNREHYIIGERKKETGGKGACVVYRVIDAFYLPSKQGSDTQKKERKRKKSQRSGP